MGTTAQKLQAIVDSKAAIKAAIEAKGVSDVGDVLSDYADKIEAIPSGGGEDSLTTPFYIEHMLSDESFWGDTKVQVHLAKKGTGSPTLTLQTSWDSETWTDWDYVNDDLFLDVAEKGGHPRVYIKAKTTNATWSAATATGNKYNAFIFFSRAEQVGVAVGGNIMSLLYGTGFDEQTTLTSDYTFVNLFYPNISGAANNPKLFSSEKLVLPATTLSTQCYYQMFMGCTNHKRTFAELPAEAGTQGCYYGMFYDNTALEKVPSVKAKVGAGQFMYRFAYNCASLKSFEVLTTNGSLPSVSGSGTGEEMQQAFYGCTSLESAYFPNLKYIKSISGVFTGDTSLVGVYMPNLEAVATSLTSTFNGCTSLTTVYIPKLSIMGTASNTFNGCTSLATVDFSQATAVPALSNINAFENTNNDYKILVPLALNTEWVATTNWSDESIAPHIVAVGGNALMFVAQASGSTIKLAAVGESAPTLDIEVSTDGGTTFVAYTVGTTITLTNAYETAMFRAGSTGQSALAVDASNYNKFTMTGSLYIVGDISYLLNQSGVSTSTALADYAFTGLFKNCTALVNAPALPWTTMGESCYAHMFEGCNSLRTAPELPATTLDDYCYANMFEGCTALKEAPYLPATTLATGCYNGMFYNATNLGHIGTNWWGLFQESDSFTNWVYGVAPNGTFDWTGEDTTTGPSAIPTGWVVVNEAKRPLTFTAREGGVTVKLEKKVNGTTAGVPSVWPTVQLDFSVNNGATWLSYTIGDTILLANIGDTVQFRATNTNGAFTKFNSGGGGGGWGGSNYCYHTFTTTGAFDLSGHIDSLRNIDWTQAGDAPNYAYYYMFYQNKGVVDASNLKMNAASVGTWAYYYMFRQNTRMTKGPEIYATTIGSGAFNYLFYGCTRLSEIKIHYTGNFSSSYFSSWVQNIAASGTLYYNGTDTTTGNNAIPTGWTVASF